MKVQAKYQHVFAVTREVEVDEAEFREWADTRYGTGYDLDLALAAWIDQLDIEHMAEVFPDWKTSLPLPSDFELQYTDVIDAQPSDPS